MYQSIRLEEFSHPPSAEPPLDSSSLNEEGRFDVAGQALSNGWRNSLKLFTHIINSEYDARGRKKCLVYSRSINLSFYTSVPF